MIEVKQVSKTFGTIEAVKQLSLKIHSQNVFGMLGTNGAGKSTLLRMMAGVLKPDEGEILIDDERVWDNPLVKKRFFYISDEQFFYPNATAFDMERFYSSYYRDFDGHRYAKLLVQFGLDGHRKIQTYSKEMKKQLSSYDMAVQDMALAYNCNCFYLYYLLYSQKEIQQLHLRAMAIISPDYPLHDSSKFVDSIA